MVSTGGRVKLKNMSVGKGKLKMLSCGKMMKSKIK